MNGYIVTINENKEDTFLFESVSDNHYWTGGFRLSTTDGWQWVTGET